MFGFGKKDRQQEPETPRVPLSERVSEETLDKIALVTGNFDRLRGRMWQIFVDNQSHVLYFPTLDDPDQNIRPIAQS